jgi:hypothetical protein
MLGGQAGLGFTESSDGSRLLRRAASLGKICGRLETLDDRAMPPRASRTSRRHGQTIIPPASPKGKSPSIDRTSSSRSGCG